MRAIPVFRGVLKRKKEKTKIAFARILREVMRKNKVRWRDVSLCAFEEYENIYNKFWSKKKSVTKDDIEFMVKLIEERAVERVGSGEAE
jgi:hypothetical protein